MTEGKVDTVRFLSFALFWQVHWVNNEITGVLHFYPSFPLPTRPPHQGIVLMGKLYTCVITDTKKAPKVSHVAFHVGTWAKKKCQQAPSSCECCFEVDAKAVWARYAVDQTLFISYCGFPAIKALWPNWTVSADCVTHKGILSVFIMLGVYMTFLCLANHHPSWLYIHFSCFFVLIDLRNLIVGGKQQKSF